ECLHKFGDHARWIRNAQLVPRRAPLHFIVAWACVPLPSSTLRGAADTIALLVKRVRCEPGVILTELVLEVGAMSLPDLESAVDREEELSRGFDDALDDVRAANRSLDRR
ncbi:hypothetical protein, partial [Streptomyces exfoliatus]|uniref:hypothetical protein n=1 Tax=Streptomyces exfoliatus TaxID=1905 RepID=UPI003C2C6522